MRFMSWCFPTVCTAGDALSRSFSRPTHNISAARLSLHTRSPCKTAASNALRLSSALRRTPPPHNAHVSLVNCEEVRQKATATASFLAHAGESRNRQENCVMSIRSCRRRRTRLRPGVTTRGSNRPGALARCVRACAAVFWRDCNARVQVLYNSNDMEPHVALQLIEKIVRLMQPAAAEASSQVASGADAGYEKNQKPDDKVRSLTAVAETFGC